jgi:hypothetical protein
MPEGPVTIKVEAERAAKLPVHAAVGSLGSAVETLAQNLDVLHTRLAVVSGPGDEPQLEKELNVVREPQSELTAQIREHVDTIDRLAWQVGRMTGRLEV